MLKRKLVASALAAAAGLPLPAVAADSPELQQIQNEIQQLKQSYDARIRALEARLKAAETAARQARDAARQAEGTATQAAIANAPAEKISSFNPAVSLILSGIYANLSEDPAQYKITGFPVPQSVEIGPGKRGFSLAESELGIYANIDPYFYGAMHFSIHPDDTVSTEEAYIQTLGLSHGLTVKAGRFYSGIGYLNEQHSHTWDFVDAPLAYQAFLGGQFGDDGVQLRWLAPTDTFIELGAELGRGRGYPGSDRDKNGAGASALYAHVGGDVGISNSWRAGLSLLATSPQDREYDATDLAGNTVTNSFSGNSKLWIADFVWKYAPNGNPYYTNFKLQGEYLRRREDGSLGYDLVNGAATQSAAYSADQSGWYLQGIYQFMPYWRVGLRTERLNPGSVDYGLNNAYLPRPDYNPSKNSVMVDYSPSEFSRVRLQFSRDKAQQGVTDNETFLQYQVSLGAHGAHIF